MKPKKLKRVVIKEELVELTGHYVQALILNQFIYWSERTKDFDEFIREERQRAIDSIIEVEPADGWVYKSADQLSDELMLGMVHVTMRKHLVKLVDQGYLSQRRNPNFGWDRTWQYRPNMVKIQTDLQEMGYALESYPLVIEASKTDIAMSENDGGWSENDIRTNENLHAIPETTLEITTETHGAENFSPKRETDFPEIETPLASNGSETKTPQTSVPAEKDEFAAIFGENPRQAEIEAHAAKPRPGRDEVLIQTLAGTVGQGVKFYVEQLRAENWKFESEAVEIAMAEFFSGTHNHNGQSYFPIPGGTTERKKWVKGIKIHLEEPKFGGMLGELYKMVWDEIGSKVRDGNLTVTHPGAFTVFLYSALQRQAQAGPPIQRAKDWGISV